MSAALVLIGAALRFFYFAADRSLWSGEWSSIEFSMPGAADIIRATAADVHPPLYFLTLHGFARLFGESDWVYRAPGLLAGIAALPAIYGLGRELFGKQAARWALFLTALSPLAVHQSVEIRNHGPLMLWTALGTLSFLKALKGSRFWSVSFVVSAAAAVYTVHFAWFWLAALLLTHVREIKRTLPALIVCAPALALMCYQSLRDGEWTGGWMGLSFSVFSLFKDAAAIVWSCAAGPLAREVSGNPVFFGFSASLVAGALALTAAAFGNGWKNQRHTALFFALTVPAPVLLMMAVNPSRLDARYFAFGAAFWYLWLGDGLARCRPSVQKLAAGLFAGVSLTNVVWMSALKTDPFFREDERAMIRTALAEAGPNDIINDSPLLRYYQRTRGWATRATVYGEAYPEDLHGEYEKVWMLDSQPLASAPFAYVLRTMRDAGYVPDRPERVFGGPESRSVLNTFKRVSQP